MGQFGPLWASRIWEAASRQYSDSNDSWLLSQDLVRTQPQGCELHAPQPAAGQASFPPPSGCRPLCCGELQRGFSQPPRVPSDGPGGFSAGASHGSRCSSLQRPVLRTCLPGLPGVPALSPCLRELAELSLPRLPQPSLGTLKATARAVMEPRSPSLRARCPALSHTRRLRVAVHLVVSGKKESSVTVTLCWLEAGVPLPRLASFHASVLAPVDGTQSRPHSLPTSVSTIGGSLFSRHKRWRDGGAWLSHSGVRLLTASQVMISASAMRPRARLWAPRGVCLGFSPLSPSAPLPRSHHL